MNLLQLVVKNSLRKKARFTLTCLSVVVAFFLFTALAGIDHALNSSVANSNQFRLMTRHKISMTHSLPINYLQKIQSVDGVELVSYTSWFGGFFQNESQQLSVFAVNSDNYLALFPEYLLSPTEHQAWQKNRVGLLVSARVAQQYHWQIGDRVPLSSSIWMNKQGNFSWDFVVSGIYQTKDLGINDSSLFFHHAYFDENRAYASYAVSWFSILIGPNADSDIVNASIDASFENSSAATRTSTEQVFLKQRTQQFVDMAALLKLILAAVFFTLLLIVCNTMAQAMRERQQELAIMQAMGFSVWYLLYQLLLESGLLIALGALLGSALATGSLHFLQYLLRDYLPGIALDPTHYLWLLLMVLVVSLLCCLFPAIAVKRASIASVLGAKL
jgi:putative ABC transport system permease protein